MLFDVCLAEGEAQRVDIHSCQGAEQGHGREGTGTNKEKTRKDKRECEQTREESQPAGERGQVGQEKRERGKTLADAHDKIANTKGTNWACHMEGRHKLYSGGQSTLVDRSRHTTSQQVWTMSQP